MNNKSYFGERLKELMDINNLKVKDIKTLLGTDVSNIYKWLKNVSFPSFKNILTLADYFTCSLDFLVGRTEIYEKLKFKEVPKFSHSLRAAMQEKHITEYRLNKDTDISRSILYEWFTDYRNPSIDNLIILADYFDCSIDYLIGREK
jgi:transcriptional regulator with XRE-family HTH domain